MQRESEGPNRIRGDSLDKMPNKRGGGRKRLTKLKGEIRNSPGGLSHLFYSNVECGRLRNRSKRVKKREGERAGPSHGKGVEARDAGPTS